MLSNYSAIFILSLSLLTTNFTGGITTTHSQVIKDRSFQPNLTYSLLDDIKFPPASQPTLADCAHLCLRSTRCRTAVFEAQQLICVLYSETATSSGRLVMNSSGSFSTIITDKPPDSLIFVPSNVTVYAIWNTTAGQNSLSATPGTGSGQYWAAHTPNNVFDANWTSLFCSYGTANAVNGSSNAGVNTGVYLTVSESSFVLKGFRIVRARFSTARDPMRLTIEGSNQTGSVLTIGTSWTLIYNGTTGLEINPGNGQPGIKQDLLDGTLAFSSYRFLMTAQRGNATCTEYAEIEMYRT